MRATPVVSVPISNARDAAPRQAAGIDMAMSGGLLAFALLALVATQDSWVNSRLFTADGPTGVGWTATLTPLALVAAVAGSAQSMKRATAGLVFLAFAVLLAIALANAALGYTAASLTIALVAGAAGYAVLAIISLATDHGMQGAHRFGLVALVGAIAATLIAAMFGSRLADLALAWSCIAVFAALAPVTVRSRAATGRRAGHRHAPPTPARLGLLTLYLDLLARLPAPSRIASRRRRRARAGLARPSRP